MPDHLGYTRDGKHQEIDEGLWNDAKKSCEGMQKRGSLKGELYGCITGTYMKMWRNKHGRELLSSPPKGKGGGKKAPAAPSGSAGVTAGD